MDDFIQLLIIVLIAALIIFGFPCQGERAGEPAASQAQRRAGEPAASQAQRRAGEPAASQAQRSGGGRSGGGVRPRVQDTVVVNINSERRNQVELTAASDGDKVVCFLISSKENRPEGADGNGECAICLSGEEVPYLWAVVPQCRHGFHANCLVRWLMVNKNCPACRKLVPSSEFKLKFND